MEIKEGDRGTDPLFRRLSLTAVVSIFILVVVGGIVRVTESGLGCPDWPLCHGRVVPSADAHTIIEYSHRVLASIVGVLLLVLTVLAWRGYRNRVWIVVGSTVSLGLVIIQGVLGGVTVLTELHGDVVTAHLLLAEVVLFTTVLVFLAAWRGLRFSHRHLGVLPPLTVITVVGVLILILTGSYTTTSGASGACYEWPLCQGQIFMLDRLPAIHMIHRYVALLVGPLVFLTAVTAWMKRDLIPNAGRMGVAAAVVFLTQVFVGAMAVWWALPEEVRVLHLALATLLWIVVVVLALLPYLSLERGLQGTDFCTETESS